MLDGRATREIDSKMAAHRNKKGCASNYNLVESGRDLFFFFPSPFWGLSQLSLHMDGRCLFDLNE